MKKLVLAFLVLTISLSASAITNPVCAIPGPGGEIKIPPCVYDQSTANILLIDMMLENKAGMMEVATTGVSGMEIGVLDNNDTVTVTFMSERIGPASIGGVIDYHSTTKYELKLNDCRGTDQCSGTYLWTVIAKTTGDGFMSETTFTNQLTEVK